MLKFSKLTATVLAISCSLGAQVGWAVGGNGGIFRSADGGRTWSSSFPTSALLNDIATRDGFTAWIAGGGVLLRTTNGGRTWTDTYSGSAVLNGVHFVDDAVGWAVGTSGTILKSTDGGRSWSAQRSGSSAVLWDVYFVNANVGWACGGQIILRTVDGGRSWTNGYRGGAVLRSVYFRDSRNGWAVGAGGAIARSVDGGRTWIDRFPTSAVLYSVRFTSATTGWIAGGSILLRTTNGGGSWSSRYSGGATLTSVRFLDSRNGWAVGTTGTVLRTTNGGTSWSTIRVGTSATLTSAEFGPARPAGFTAFGAGCSGGSSTPVLRPRAGSLPWLASTFTSEIASTGGGARSAVMLLGATRPAPRDLGPFGWRGCSLYVSADLAQPVGVSNRLATWSVLVPAQGFLAGQRLFQQAAVIDPAASGGVAFSNAAELLLGLR